MTDIKVQPIMRYNPHNDMLVPVTQEWVDQVQRRMMELALQRVLFKNSNGFIKQLDRQYEHLVPKTDFAGRPYGLGDQIRVQMPQEFKLIPQFRG